jgi:uncharacterized lipoprotein YddW (UPF0748 family)
MTAYEFMGGLRSHRKQEYAKAYWDFLNGRGNEPVRNIGFFSAWRIRSRLALIKRISQTQAKAELDKIFGVAVEECEAVCDDCYKQLAADWCNWFAWRPVRLIDGV